MPVPQSLIDRLTKHLGSMSEARERVARFLVSHWERAAFMTAAQIGEASNSSETVVIRLADELGYSGFPELQRDLQREVHSALSTAKRLERSHELADPVTESFTRNEARMKEIARNNPVETFDKTANMIMSARSVCVMGVRTAHAPALVLGQALLHLRASVFVVPEPSVDWYDILKFFGKEDLHLAISFPRYWKETIEALRYARNRGATAVAITDNPVSPAAREADISLLTSTDSAGFSLSYTGCFAVIDALLAAVARRAGQQNAGILAELEAIYEKVDLFHRSEAQIRRGAASRGTEHGKGR